MKELMDKMAMNDSDDSMEHEDIEAKMEVLRELHQMMTDVLGQDLNQPEMEKVEVMAEDEEGLEEGLDMAKDLMKKKDESTGDFY